MAKRKPFVNLKKGETENGFSMHVLHERPSKHDENASLPKMFQYEVDESCTETWAEGLSMFHNPNAVNPVPEHLFPTVAHHHFEDGQITSMLPEFYPYSSVTMSFKVKRSNG